jgi:anti-sigma factor RsiW
MKRMDPHKLWDFIDGQCSPEEAEQIKAAMEKDETLKTEWAKRYQLQQALKEVPAEQPSMRFVQNLMDRLPQMYQKLSIAPLVKPLWVRVTTGFLAFLVAGYFGFVWYYVETVGVSGRLAVLDSVSNVLSQMPSQLMVVVAAVTIGMSFLILIDAFLKKRFQEE